MEAGIGEGVENGCRDVAETVDGEVLGHDGRKGLGSFDGACRIDADRENGDDHCQDSHAHVGRGPADQAGTEDGQEEDDDADDADAGVVVEAGLGVDGRGGAGNGSRYSH